MSRCPKCQGLAVAVRFYDYTDRATIWKCVNCGLLLDPVILRHRRACRTGTLPKPSAGNHTFLAKQVYLRGTQGSPPQRVRDEGDRCSLAIISRTRRGSRMP